MQLSKTNIGIKLLVTIAMVIQSLYSYSQWSELGGFNALQASGQIYGLCSDAAGNIYAGGFFKNSANNYYVAKYDGTSWTELGGFNALAANGAIYTLYADAAGNIYAGGEFSNANNKRYVAKFNGSVWSEVGGTNSLQANGAITSVYADNAGNIYATGDFSIIYNSVYHRYIAVYNGSNWSDVGGAAPTAMEFNNGPFWKVFKHTITGDIYAVGGVRNSAARYCVAHYSSSWNELGGFNALHANGSMTTACQDSVGSIYAAGNFWNANNKPYVAKYDGTWSELGGNNSSVFNHTINSIFSDASNIYAAGRFTNTNGKAYVAKYDGISWAELGSNNPFNNDIQVICKDPAGNIYAAGHFSNTASKYYVAKLSATSLPVHFLSFTAAKKSNETIQLTWQITKESNADNFNIERSSNATSFSTVATVKPNNTNTYVYEDAVGANNSPALYYRIKSTDKDGKVLYSPVQKVAYGKEEFADIKYSTETNKLYISVNGKAVLRIADIHGRIVQSTPLENNYTEFSLQNFIRGVYIIEVQNGREKTTRKIAKK